MNEYVVTLLFLLFSISLNDAHTLSRIELNNITDVYEVKEGESTLTITHPKDDKPTLREIVYFHVIEKPYDSVNEDTQVAKTPDLNSRSFTNGHGYQYLNEDTDASEDSDADDDDDDDETLNADNDSNDEPDDTDDIEDDDDNDDDDDENDIETKPTESTNYADDKKDDGKNDDKVRDLNDETENPKDSNDKPNVDVRFGDTADDNTTVAKDIDVAKENLESRRKREIDYTNLPAAPELPELNLNNLPDYIKAIILDEQDTNQKTNRAQNFEDEIEKQVRELEKAVNHPPSVERDNDREREIRTYGKSLTGIEGGQKGEDRTYGMSLTGDRGVIWNDVNTHLKYYVSEPETITSTTSRPKATDEPISDEDNNSSEDGNNSDELNYLDDKFDEINKLLDDLIKESENVTEDPIDTDEGNYKERNLDARFGDPADDNESEIAKDNRHIAPSFEELENREKDLEDAINHSPLVEIENNKERKREANTYGNSLVGDKKGGNGIKREAKTYGMSLVGDRGLVWNDVNTHLSYHVGEPESSTASKPDVTDSTIPTTAVTSDKDTNSSEDGNDLDEFKDIVDSFDEINKLLEDLINESTSETTTANNKDTSKRPDSQNDKTTVDTTVTVTATEDTTKATTTEETTTIKTTTETSDEITDEGTSTQGPKIENPGDINNDKKDNNGTNHNDGDTKQKQFVRELIKNKYFWQWLQDSSAAYLEIIMKKLDDLINAEVGKQIKKYFEEHKNITNCKPDNNVTQNTTENPIQSNNVTDVNSTSTTTQKPIDTNNVTDVDETSTIQPPSTNNPTNNTGVDEPENNNKTKGELARRPNNKESNDNKNKPVKIEAQNVYGNSVGNGKVTNIFIFNISKEYDLEKLKPLSNGTNGVFVFGHDEKKADKEKNDHKNDDKVITSTPGPTNDEKENINKENKKEPDNQASTTKPEISKDPVIDEPKENIEDSTTENAIVTDEQTTSIESVVSTVNTNYDKETTEKSVESTTVAAEKLTTKMSKDNSETDKTEQPETAKPKESTEKYINNDDETQKPDEDLDAEVTSKTESTKNDEVNADDKNKDSENLEKDSTKGTITTESTTEIEKKSEENEIDHNE